LAGDILGDLDGGLEALFQSDCGGDSATDLDGDSRSDSDELLLRGWKGDYAGDCDGDSHGDLQRDLQEEFDRDSRRKSCGGSVSLTAG